MTKEKTKPKVKVWHVATGEYDPATVDVSAFKKKSPSFIIEPRSYLANGIKADVPEGLLTIPWLDSYEQGLSIFLLVDGSGLFTIANMSAQSGFIILKSTKPKEKPIYDLTRAFIIMSMSNGNKTLDDIRDSIQRGVDDAAKELHFPEVKCFRVDDRRGATYKIDDEIFSNLEQSGLIVCDLTEEKPNCYYELAWAMAHKRQVIVTAKKETTIHFDVSRFNIQFWENMRELQDKVRTNAIAIYSKQRFRSNK